MPSIGKVGDYAGGVIFTGIGSVTINDLPIVRVGSLISDHGDDDHDAATMVTGFSGVTVEDIPVCLAGNPASCGHILISNNDVEAG